MTRIECSVWSNGADGFGLRILGGATARLQHFDRSKSLVQIEIDGDLIDFNVDKKSFWAGNCGELIGKQLIPWFRARNLKPGDHVWLEIIEPKKQFRLIQ